ncbi:MAG TPA: methyl-accepting chemotaxis protein, partial [Allocoleopsis sp.]
ASSVNETTTTMDELNASSRVTAEQAETGAKGAKKALTLAESGLETVEKTLSQMTNLKEKVAAIAQAIVLLNEQTMQISNISALVGDLANQTNMLALNAAVEAVRAGEQGKGFSVVASEIRKLADQSKKSADKINTLIIDIQKSINSTVMATETGSQTVAEGVYIVQETAKAFKGVSDAIEQIAVNNQQIALNAQQQALGVEQVVEAMNSINVGARETAGGLSQTKIGLEKLDQAAISLKEVV